MKKPVKESTTIRMDVADFSRGGLMLAVDDDPSKPWEFDVEAQNIIAVLCWKDAPVECPAKIKGNCFDEKNCRNRMGSFSIDVELQPGGEDHRLPALDICFYVNWEELKVLLIKRLFNKELLRGGLLTVGIDPENPKWGTPIPIEVKKPLFN